MKDKLTYKSISLSYNLILMNKIQIQPYDTPCGRLLLGSYEGQLCLCDWATDYPRSIVHKRIYKMLHAEYEVRQTAVIREATYQLDAYFRKERTVFDVPLLRIGTSFQQTVWEHLLAIPYGVTLSYAELARRVHKPKAIRAVANANRANALSLFIPCHRIISSDGTLKGYAGGLDAKRFLLALEGVRV